MSERSHDRQNRLESWKEIADFLDVSVRTAQHWERLRSLPVRRHPGERRSRVFAYTTELESWLTQESDQPTEPSTGPEKRRIPTLKRRRSLSVIALILGVIGVIHWQSFNSRAVPAACELIGTHLSVTDATGETLWTRSIAELPNSGESGVSSAFCLTEDIDADDRVEVLIDVRPESLMSQSSTLHCFDHDGRLRWSRAPGLSIGNTDPRVAPAFTTHDVQPVDIDGAAALLSISFHHPLYPTEVALLDPSTGDSISTPYFHPGRFYDSLRMDVDGDGRDELVLGGVRNPGAELGQPVVAVLDLPFDRSGSRRRDFFGGNGPIARTYIRFPRLCLSDVRKQRAHVITLGRIGTDRLMAKVGIPGALSEFVVYSIGFDANGEPLVENIVLSDHLIASHRAAFIEGLVDHALSEAEIDRLRDLESSTNVYEARSSVDRVDIRSGDPDGT